MICPSSPYLEAYFLPLVTHIFSRYAFDALWLDGGRWLIDNLCHCGNCRTQFTAATGYSLPQEYASLNLQVDDVSLWKPGAMPAKHAWTFKDNGSDQDPVWIAWLTWRLAQSASYLESVVKTVHAINPEVVVIDNNSGRWTHSQTKVEDNGRLHWLTPAELGVGILSCDPVASGGNHEIILSQNGRYQATTGLPFDYMNERFHKWGEWQMRSLTDFKLEFATILAVSGRCNFADQPYADGRIEPEVYRRLRCAYDFVQAREPFVQNARMVPDIAVLASAPSQLLGPIGSGLNASRQTHGKVGSNTHALRRNRVEGAHLSLVESGFQCLIYDEPTLRQHLSEQTAVIVPEQCLLEAATIKALETYVNKGGSLLVTGRSGWWDECYQAQDKSALYNLLGLKLIGEHPAPINFIRFEEAYRTQTNLPDMPYQCWGTAVNVKAVNATVLADLIAPNNYVWRDGIQDEAHWQHHTVMGACPPGNDIIGPAITLNQVGKGQAMFIAVDPFAAYRHDGHHLTRQLIEAALNTIAPKHNRRLSVKKPLHVEASLQETEDKLIVHLVNYFAQKRQSSALIHNEEITPVHNIKVQVKLTHAPKSVCTQPNDERLTWQYEDNIVTTIIPKLDVHTMALFYKAE